MVPVATYTDQELYSEQSHIFLMFYICPIYGRINLTVMIAIIVPQQSPKTIIQKKTTIKCVQTWFRPHKHTQTNLQDGDVS